MPEPSVPLLATKLHAQALGLGSVAGRMIGCLGSGGRRDRPVREVVDAARVGHLRDDPTAEDRLEAAATPAASATVEHERS